MICTKLISRKGQIHPILRMVLLLNSWRGKDSDDLCLFFCLYPSSIHSRIVFDYVTILRHNSTSSSGSRLRWLLPGKPKQLKAGVIKKNYIRIKLIKVLTEISIAIN